MNKYSLESQLVDEFCSVAENSNTPWGALKLSKEFNYQRGKTDIVAIDTNDNVLAFEMKLSKWKYALCQAFRNTCFANQSYVVLPETLAFKVYGHKSEFDRRSVGLCYITNGTIVALILPCQQDPIQPWLTEKAKKKIYR